MPTGGTLVIETKSVDIGADDLARHPGVPPGRYVVLAVADSGAGMSAEVRRHLFEPFFTTKDPGKGTGLGLAVVHGFIKQSGGYIEVDSRLGEGSTFTIYLPRVDAAAVASASAPAPKGEPAHPRGGEVILLVEDDEGVRALNKRVLQACGYEVLEASRGDAALRACEAHAGPIDILVTDVVMPGGGGRQLADQLRVLQEHLKVLYVSGYTDDAVLRHGVLHAEVNFLQKPFTSSALTNKVRNILDSADAPRRTSPG
jgi:CheY-like chemotaxis protein